MESVIRQVRGWAAAVTGILVTAIFGAFTLATALPYRLLIDPWARYFWQNPLEHMPRFWGRCLTKIIMTVAGARIVVHGSVRPASAREILLVIGNHPSTIATPIWIGIVTQLIVPRIVAVAKWEHLWNPFFGTPLWAIRGGIFINRKRRSAAKAKLRAGLRSVGTSAVAIVICPDERRVTRIRLAAALAKFGPHIPGLDRWLVHTLFPKSGGVLEIIANLDQSVRVVNATTGFTVPDESIRAAGVLSGATLHVHLEELSEPLPLDEATLQSWLVREWQRKNAMIHAWRHSSSDTRNLS